MKKIMLVFSVLVLNTFFVSCSDSYKKQENKKESFQSFRSKEKAVIVQVLEGYHHNDVYGDSLSSDRNQYYLLTQDDVFIPAGVVGDLSPGRMPIAEYLSSLASMGNLSFDTVTLPAPQHEIKVKIFYIKGVHPKPINL